MRKFVAQEERNKMLHKLSFVRMTAGKKHAWFFDKKLGKEIRKQFAKGGK